MMSSIGDLARGLVLQRQTANLKAEVTRLSTELATGRVRDVGRAQRSELGPLAALEAAAARATALRAAADEALTLAGAMQTALTAIDATAEGLAAALPTLGPDPGPDAVAAMAADARARFDAVISHLSARSGDRSLFAGAATDRPAVAPAAEMLAALRAAVTTSGATEAAAIAAVVQAWFDDPSGGYTLDGYRGSAAPLGPVDLGQGGRLSLPVTAADPAVRRTLAALATAALAADEPDPALRPGLLAAAHGQLIDTAAGRAQLQGTLGRAEARLQEASVAQAAERAALAAERDGLIGADPYASATDLELAQTRIETLYALTARLSRLSLAAFLR